MKSKRLSQRQLEDDRKYLPALLKHYHGLGYSLEQCGDRRRLNRRPVDLLQHARMLGLHFPDHAEVAEQARLEAMGKRS